MSYLYFPGCSLKGTGKAYDESFQAVFQSLAIDYKELEDWNCCGATTYMSISECKAFALSARNLALAEKQASQPNTNLVAPCAACYLVLNKTQKYLKDYPDISDVIKGALKTANLQYKGTVKVRHPLDILINDIGKDKIAANVKAPLKGLKVACYYGCQIVRPYSDFDNQDNPTSMDTIIQALGAETIDWPLKTRCCSGSISATIAEAGQRLSYILLREARKHKADVVATACPLCQFNLECFQDKMSGAFNDNVNMPVVYFTQLMGLAFGIPENKLGMQRLFIPIKKKVEGGAYVSR